jgi:hypothetical protein
MSGGDGHPGCDGDGHAKSSAGATAAAAQTHLVRGGGLDDVNVGRAHGRDPPAGCRMALAPGSVLSFGARRLRGQPHSSPAADNLWSDGGPGRTGSSRLVVRETVASVDLQYNES